MKIYIELNQDNAAFEDGPIETQRILHELIKWKFPIEVQGFHEGPIYDKNGNKCGKWEVINK